MDENICLVFIIPARYFAHMAEAMAKLGEYYESSTLKPYYIATMQQPYAFENGAGVYAEFIKGDSFAIFSCADAGAGAAAAFGGSFPTRGVLRESRWEAVDIKCAVMHMDDELRLQFRAKFQGIQFKRDVEQNVWVRVESFAHYMTHTHQSPGE